jgi:chemotaxis protein CheC
MRCLGVGAMQDPVSVVQEFSGTPRGKVALAFSHDTAACLASALTGERLDSPELDSVKVGTLVEVGNIVINGFVGSIANLFDGDVVFGLPEFHDHGLSGLVGGNEGADAPGVVVVAETRFHIEHLDLGGYLFLVLEMRNIGHLLVELEPRRGGA